MLPSTHVLSATKDVVTRGIIDRWAHFTQNTAAKKNVVRKIEGVIPSQRKAFRMEEVQRLRSLYVERDESSSVESDTTHPLTQTQC